MFWLKKIIFKFMELGLGLRTCFSLETKDPIFVNFRLSESETEAVRRSLPAGVKLRPIKFSDDDADAAYWISYNLYELRYPKKELQAVRKVRCEINTFVEDAHGRCGVYVFCGSPYVSKETRPSLIGRVCDFAERLVMFIYGCGRLVPMQYELAGQSVRIRLAEGANRIALDRPIDDATTCRLSDEYHRFNDISFFNGGRTYDLVNVNSRFLAARFARVPAISDVRVTSPFFDRAPDEILFHRGEIAYMVNSLNRL